MIIDFDKILNDLSSRLKDGTPDLTNEQHLIKLFDVLKEYNWPVDERVRLLQNLTEGTDKKLAYKEVGKKLAKTKSIEQQGTVTSKVYGDISSEEFIKRIKTIREIIFWISPLEIIDPIPIIDKNNPSSWKYLFSQYSLVKKEQL